MRRAARALILVGALAVPLILGAMAIAMLHPYRATEIAIAKLDDLNETPRLVELAGMSDLVALARSRHGGFTTSQHSRRSLLPVWMLRKGDAVRAFIAVDPRNGCDLEVWPPEVSARYGGYALFHDVCHGSLYDGDGRPVGGPSPFTLDELELRVSESVVYASTVNVRAGVCVPC